MNNSTVNTSLPKGLCPQTEPSTEGKVFKTLAYSCVMVLSLVGNLVVVMIVYKNHSMRTTVNYLIVNMAVSDLLQSSIAIPKRMVEVYAGSNRWLIEGISGELTCKCVAFLQDISTAVSIQSLVVIAFDRFFGVMFPMKTSTISSKMHSAVIGMTWLVAMGFHSPYFFTFRLDNRNNQTFCIYTWLPLPNEAALTVDYFLAGSITLFYFPLALIVILYSAILVSLRRQKIPGHDSFRNRRSVAKRNRNVLRMVIAVVVLFAICWLPLNTITYLATFKWAPNTQCSSGDLFFWALFLAYSNAAFNPCMYFLFSENYRQGFKGVFKGRGVSLQTSVQTRRRNCVEGGEISGTDTRNGISMRSIRSSSSAERRFCMPHFSFKKK